MTAGGLGSLLYYRLEPSRGMSLTRRAACLAAASGGRRWEINSSLSLDTRGTSGKKNNKKLVTECTLSKLALLRHNSFATSAINHL